jgi:hypothetical protein
MVTTPARTAPRHPLAYLCEDWLAVIDRGLKQRDERFGKYAQEALNFFDGDNNWMWDAKYAQGPQGFLAKDGVMPMFQISVNKLFEAVALFGPVLYHQNPNVLVSPLQHPEIPPEALGFAPEDPMYQQLFMEDQFEKARKDACAQVKTAYLNWLQYESDKKTHARRTITEAIVAGLGLFETTMFEPPFSEVAYPRTQHLSWKDMVVDPDAEYWEDVQWIAIRRRKAVNKTERRFGLFPGDLKGQFQSGAAQESSRGRKEIGGQRGGESFDIIEYWEVYSKNGMGDKLKGKHEDNQAYNFDELGDYCYIVVSRGIPFPLNLPSNFLLESTDPEELAAKVQWPIPYWYDASSDGGWPVVRLTFYDKPNSVWPIGMFKPAIGELRFVNWCLSFLADKTAQSCTTYLGVMKAAGIEMQKQIGNGRLGPYQLIELSQVTGHKIDELVKFLQAPDFPQHIWNMVAQVLELIDRRTGLTELSYGLTSRQMRSATEANVRDANISVRPDDMAQSVENALSLVNVREMQAARWLCEPEDIAPAVGRMGAMVWQQLVQTQNIDSVVRDFAYRVEAGSARKPNKQNRAAQLTELGQVLLPVIAPLAQAGIVAPFNAYITDVAKAMDLDPSGYLIQLPPPGEQGPSPEEQAAQAELLLKQAEMEFKQVGMQQELVHEEEKHDQEIRHEEEKFGVELKHAESKAKADIAAVKQKAAATAKAKPKPKPGAKK